MPENQLLNDTSQSAERGSAPTDTHPDGAKSVGLSRKDEIIAATIRVIERKGISGASMRAIAHEMGLTTGVITHYFTDKDQLLLEVLQTCFTPWRQTIEQGKGCKSAWEQLRHLFFSTLPSYHQPRARVQVWLGMLLQIEKDPALLRAYKENYDLIRDEVFELIRQCQNDGLIHAGLDPVLEGNRLFALSDGLVVSVLGEPEIYTQEVVAQMMELQFAALQP